MLSKKLSKVLGINLFFASYLGMQYRGPESWYRWYRRYQTNHILLDEMTFRWTNNWSYYGKSEEILSYSDKLGIVQ